MRLHLTSLLRNRVSTSFACSSGIHLLAISGFFVAELAFLAFPTVAFNGGVELEPIPVELLPGEAQLITAEEAPRSWMATSAEDVTDLVARVNDPRWAEALLDAADPDQERATVSEFIHQRLLDSIVEAEGRADDENLDRLRSLSDQLSSVSSEESVDQVTASLKRWLGVGDRATQPAVNAPTGEFDDTTAQLHDVLRVEDDGRVRYAAILLDAQGRTTEAALTESEGEAAYQLFQTMKQNPLLERVYRGFVLSLLDRLIRERAH
jgi:hypothetical protein